MLKVLDLSAALLGLLGRVGSRGTAVGRVGDRVAGDLCDGVLSVEQGSSLLESSVLRGREGMRWSAHSDLAVQRGVAEN